MIQDTRCRIKPDAGFWIRDAGYRRKADPAIFFIYHMDIRQYCKVKKIVF